MNTSAAIQQSDATAANAGPSGLAPAYSSQPFAEREERARIAAVLSRVHLFTDLPPMVIDEIARSAVLRQAKTAHQVVHPYELGNGLYVMVSGRVKSVMGGEQGREVTVTVIRPGEIFGEVALFDAKARLGSVTIAMEPSTFIAIPREEIVRRLMANPNMAMKFIAELTRRLRRSDETIFELALCDVSKRLARRLIALAREEASEVPEGLLIRRRPTQQDLANMVGACRETVSRTFTSMANRGLIEPRGRSLLVTRRLLAGGNSIPQLKTA